MPGCANAILQDWAADERIDGAYARSCYEAVLRMVPEDGYGVASLLEGLEEGLAAGR